MYYKYRYLKHRVTKTKQCLRAIYMYHVWYSMSACVQIPEYMFDVNIPTMGDRPGTMC